MNHNPILAIAIAACLAPAALAQILPVGVELDQYATASLLDADRNPFLNEASAGSRQPDPDPFAPYSREISAHRSLPGGESGAVSRLRAAFVGTRSIQAAGSMAAAAHSDLPDDVIGGAGGYADIRHLTFRVLRPCTYRLHGFLLAEYRLGIYANSGVITLSRDTGPLHRFEGDDPIEPMPIDVSGELEIGEYDLTVDCFAIVDSQNDPELRHSSLSFEITLDVTPLCRADVNNDGFVDFFDFTDFATCFDGYGCPDGEDGDFNNDGFMDFFDYYEFIDAFETGC